VSGYFVSGLRVREPSEAVQTWRCWLGEPKAQAEWLVLIAGG